MTSRVNSPKPRSGWNAVAVGSSGRPGLALKAANEQNARQRRLGRLRQARQRLPRHRDRPVCGRAELAAVAVSLSNASNQSANCRATVRYTSRRNGTTRSATRSSRSQRHWIEFRRLAVARLQRIDFVVASGEAQREPFLALAAEFRQPMRWRPGVMAEIRKSANRSRRDTRHPWRRSLPRVRASPHRADFRRRRCRLAASAIRGRAE